MAIGIKSVAEIAERVQDEPWLVPAERVRRPVAQRVRLAELEQSHPLIKQAVTMCHRWAERKRGGELDASVVLVGPVGTGKTHIAKALFWSMYTKLDDGTPVAPTGRFFEANDLMQRLESTARVSEIVPVVRDVKLIDFQCPIVVIDDVGTEQKIDYIGNEDAQRIERQLRYYKIINHCYTWKISVVITSNLSLDQLADHLGPRVWSRLEQMAPKGFMLDLTGVPDWRKRQGGRA